MQSDRPRRRQADGNVLPRIRRLTDGRFDFPHSESPRKSYIVASSHRNANAFFCKSLWDTGLLGAPWEYFNGVHQGRGTVSAPTEHSILTTMMTRLKAASLSDYFSKLLACRTSSNGVFGLKAHFGDFQAAIYECPGSRKHYRR